MSRLGAVTAGGDVFQPPPSAAPIGQDSAHLPQFRMSHRRFQRQLPGETRQWIEQRLHGLERQERFEDAYALRMEMAEWLLQPHSGLPAPNLTMARLLRDHRLRGDAPPSLQA